MLLRGSRIVSREGWEGGHLHVLPDPDITETYMDFRVEICVDDVRLSIEISLLFGIHKRLEL